MAFRRIAGFLTGCSLVAAGSAALKAQSEPFVTIRSGGNLLHRPSVEYPGEAMRKGVSGVVALEVAVNNKGEVADARVLSGPEELRRAALRSVLDWHYAKDLPLPARLQVAVEFLPAPPAAAGAVGAMVRTIEPGILKSIRMPDLSDALQQALRSRLPVREGDQLTAEVQEQVHRTIREVDEHLLAVFGSAPDGIELAVFLPGSPRPAPPAPQRIRVGGNVQATNLLESQPAKYPPLAKQGGIEGTVRLAASIGRDGRIIEVQVISGHPLLVPAALEAVKQWVYKPTYLNGQPVEVVTQIDVNFTLR